jgi:cell division control protein 7
MGVSVYHIYLLLAIDVWSAGMILLFFLTGKFPLFQSNDDVEALLEIACIIGRRRTEKAATLHCERLCVAIPSVVLICSFSTVIYNKHPFYHTRRETLA